MGKTNAGFKVGGVGRYFVLTNPDLKVSRASPAPASLQSHTYRTPHSSCATPRTPHIPVAGMKGGNRKQERGSGMWMPDPQTGRHV
eukprot:2978571-Rhodomonas_salina.1